MRSITFSISLILLIAFSRPGFSQDLRINKVVGTKEELVLSILQLAVDKVSPTSNIVQREKELPMARMVEMTDAGDIDVMWAGSSKELDESLRAIRIPLLKGLLGHRIFIIREGDQSRFDDIANLTSLSHLKAGMGRFWGSTKVLLDAGLPVVSSVKYVNLFHMLDGSRFDYFPRAVHEPWSEVASYPDLELQVEENLLLIYPYAMYFYVQKDNESLHDLLLQGLELSIADGSFDKLFFSNEMIESAVAKARFSERQIMRIDNPAMHQDTPLSRSELWLDVQNL